VSLSDCLKADILINYAMELGATRAKAINSADIIVIDEVVFTGCAVCPEYGVNLMCPPSVPAPEEFRKVLSLYRRGIILQLVFPLHENEQVNHEKAYAAARQLHLMVYDLEKRAGGMGFNKALGLIAGCCRLCAACPGHGGRCSNPDKARSSMEANGISVVETCSRVGWPLEFPVKDKVNWTGLILLD
jgi:predicted metal-binding protein